MARDSGMHRTTVAPAETKSFAFPSLEILGVRVHALTMDETLDALELMASNGGLNHVVTVNPEFIMTAGKNDRFRQVLNAATLAIPDGFGVVWAGRMLGSPLPERVTGADLVEQFAARAARKGYRFFLLGAAPGVAERAADALRERHPGLIIAGTHAGSPREEEEEEICALIRAARPHALFVAYGSPNQDLWIDRNKARIGVPVSIGVGGTLDYVAGVIPRAPRWMRESGLEWLYRLTQQPSRWRRMLALPRFAWEFLTSSNRIVRESGISPGWREE